MTKKFTKDHEWVRVQGDHVVVGITDYAQSSLGDIVFVELPVSDRVLAAGEACAVVESVKAASDIYAPISGKVIENNDTIIDNPALVNASPEGDAWFFTMTMANPAEFDALMDEAAYKAYVETL